MTTFHFETANPRLIFDEAAHRYYFGDTPLPSVTTVLAAAGLLDYGFLGDRREAYLERGRRVHVMTQRDDEGSLAEEPPDVEILGYVEAWRSFKRDYGFAPRLIEHRVFHPQLQYAGTLDRLGPVRDGSEWLVDLKTGIAPAAVRYQLVAYAGALRHPRTRRRRCVELHGDGTYRVIPFETCDYQRDFNVFVSALETFRAKEEK